jgi:serine/threonine protein kinase/WD40 repeat protein
MRVMTAQLTHPQRETLESFGLGKLADDEAVVVERHLADCPACCETLLELQDDTFVELVRVGRAPEAQGGSSRCEALSIPPELADHPRYRVLELLGRGGMGEVYRAEHKLMNRPVALKVVNRRLLQDAHAAERFRREVQAAARLSHPNIVAAYDAEQAGDLHFLAMEYVDGIDLAQLVAERGPLPVRDACEFIRQAAEGLQHAYERGMVHRDIKPQNLMLVQESGVRGQESGSRGQESGVGCPGSPVVKILDFGLARFAAEADEIPSTANCAVSPRLTSLGATLGTPDYIAPEQSRCARDADIRSDIYSLGCTLYFLLAGRPPYSGSSQEKLAAHATQAPQPLSELRNDLPPVLESVVSRMMAKEPRDRYQTPKEIAAALDWGDSSPLCGAGMRHTKVESGDKSPQSKYGVRKFISAFGDRASDPQRSNARRQSGDESPHSKGRGVSAIALLAAAFLVLLGAVFYIKLGETTVKFEIEDPSLAVRFGKDEITIDNDGRPIRITPGEKQTFTVTQNGGQSQANAFTLTKGEKAVLRISVESGHVGISPRNGDIAVSPVAAPAANVPSLLPTGDRDLSPPDDPDTVRWVTELRVGELLTGQHTTGSAPVVAFAMAPDLQTIFTAHAAGLVAMSDLGQKREVASWQTGVHGASVLAASGDGKLIAVGAFNGGPIEIWDVKEEQLRSTFAGPSDFLRTMTFAPGGKMLVSGAMQRKPNAEDQAVLTGDAAPLRVWDLEEGKESKAWQIPELLRSPGARTQVDIDSARFSPDASFLAVVGDVMRFTKDGGLEEIEDFSFLWDAASGTILRRLDRVKTHATTIAFTPDEKLLVTGHAGPNVANCLLRVWDVQSGKVLREMAGHDSPIMFLDVSAQGDMAVSVDGRGEVRVWRLADGANIAQIPGRPPNDEESSDRRPPRFAAAFLADGRPIVTAGMEGVKLWPLPSPGR